MSESSLRRLYDKVKPVVDRLSGPGAISYEKFAEMCAEGLLALERLRAKQTSTILEQELTELRRRIAALEERRLREDA